MTDEELMGRVNAGERDALAELFRRYERPLVNFFVRGFGHPTDAEDLTMETFLRVFRYADRFGDRGNFRAWLYCLALSVARDWARRSRRRPEVSASSVGEAWTSVRDTHRDRDPEAMAVRGTMTAVVREAVLGLPERERAALLLREYQQLNYEEISVALGTSVSAVKMLLLRGRSRLRKRLEPDELDVLMEGCP
jgi:RNA polymerase sigma-70 factor (ECF subfamily)